MEYIKNKYNYLYGIWTKKSITGQVMLEDSITKKTMLMVKENETDFSIKWYSTEEYHIIPVLYSENEFYLK